MKASLCALAVFFSSPLFATDFIRADANQDGAVDVADPIRSLTILFLLDSLEERSTCQKSLDANDDGVIDISDPVFTLFFLFVGGFLSPPAPFPACGQDPTADTLACETFSPCPLPELTTLSSSPANGERDVAVTRETILQFSRPVSSDSLISAIFAQFAGEVLPARYHVARDGTRVTLFYGLGDNRRVSR